MIGQMATKEVLGTSLLMLVMIFTPGLWDTSEGGGLMGATCLFVTLAVAGSFGGAYRVRFVLR